MKYLENVLKVAVDENWVSVKGIVRWDFGTHYSRRGRFREENAFYRIKNGHIFPKISATNNSILPCLKKTVGLSKDGQLASTGIILQ